MAIVIRHEQNEKLNIFFYLISELLLILHKLSTLEIKTIVFVRSFLRSEYVLLLHRYYPSFFFIHYYSEQRATHSAIRLFYKNVDFFVLPKA